MSRLGIRVLCVAADEGVRAGVAALLDEAGYETVTSAAARPSLVVAVDAPDETRDVPVLVLSRPVDSDALLAQVDAALAPARAAAIARARERLSRRDARPRVSLDLYVAAASASSLAALHNLERALAPYDPRDVAVEVHDAQAAATAGVAFVPSLVAAGRTLRGALDALDAVTDLLRDAGVYARDFPDEETDT